MKLENLHKYSWLLSNFRNGWEMVRYLRGGEPVFQAVLFNGKTIVHPHKIGLVETLLELWFEKSYFPANFYSPKANDLILDLGANIGLFTLQAHTLNPHSRIEAFEPFPENFDCLSKNTSDLIPGKVNLHRYAIGSNYRQDTIVEVGDRSLDHQLQSKSTTNSDTIVKNISVDVIPFEGIFDIIQSQEISFLKIDIEGAEKDIFESTPQHIFKRIHYLAMEYHDHLRPGTLDLIYKQLTPTHYLKTCPSSVPVRGLLFAASKEI